MARDLNPGDLIITADNTAIVSRTIQSNHHDFVYNFTVANHNNYFVGKQQLWVHNVKAEKCGGGERGESSSKTTDLTNDILSRPSSKQWGVLEDGINQGVKHFVDYWNKFPERIPSLEKRLGLREGTFSKSGDGFDAFTNAAESVIQKGILRSLPDDKKIYFVEGAEKSKKGVIVIVKDGKIQSMMPGELRTFNKME